MSVDGNLTVGGTNVLSTLTDKANATDIAKSRVGLGHVDNTNDISKPLSTATRNASDLK